MGIFSRKKKNKTAKKHFSEGQMEELRQEKRWVRGTIQLYERPFFYHDARCFYDSYKEIMDDEMYRFTTSSVEPLILDCGANMGVSVLFFATQYPHAKIIAFEPEPPIFEILQKNVSTYELANVELHNKAVWDAETTLQFYTDTGMGGSVENVFKNQMPIEVPTIRFREFLTQPVALLKMDIEGAEYTVLKDCEPLFHNIENIFVEYHSFDNKQQHLDELLAMFKRNNFRYHLRQSFSRRRPLVDRNNIFDNIDMAINVFAYRQ